MHFTLHLTNRCNLSCRYCYVCQQNQDMTLETAINTVNLAVKDAPPSCGIIFFGGEPLLCRELIFDIVSYCRDLEKKIRTRFHFKITTNGTLLDNDFLSFSIKENLFIALSHDGTKTAHDFHRIKHNGSGTYEHLETIIPRLLKTRPYAPVMMTISPETVSEYAKGIKELYNKGFRYLICTLNYAGNWNDSLIHELNDQYKQLADFYYDLTVAEEKFYFSPFEVKMASHIQGENYCHERCELGKKQISVAPDGKLYPCTQFVDDPEYYIGTALDGIDEKRRSSLYFRNEKHKPECENCVVRSRCNCHCGCLNRQITGSIDHVPEILCEHERLVLPIADKLAARLFKIRNGIFIQKHYNDVYPLISMVEDLKR